MVCMYSSFNIIIIIIIKCREKFGTEIKDFNIDRVPRAQPKYFIYDWQVFIWKVKMNC